ncbi:MAG: hypothetical protein WCC53_05015 [Thermoanaerobaculia bacterium]
MTAGLATARARVRLVARVILVAGLGSAAVIYVVNSGPRSAADFELEHSRMYQHDLEVYGGRANVLADDFRSWFAGLWHGRNLAFTVAALTVLAALAYRFVATPVPGDLGTDIPGVGGVSASGGTSGKNRPSNL